MHTHLRVYSKREKILDLKVHLMKAKQIKLPGFLVFQESDTIIHVLHWQSLTSQAYTKFDWTTEGP